MASLDGQPQKCSQERWLDPLEFFANIPEIPEKILTHLLVAELQQCAQVSRLWRKQVAVSISTRRSYAYLGRNCKEIMKFSYCVESLDCCFINSLNIRAPLKHSKSCNSIPTSKQAKAVRDSIMKLRIRSLDVHVGACRATDFLLKQVLLGASATLEELTLTYLGGAVGDNVTYHMQKIFGKLAHINIRTPYGWPPSDSFNLIKLAPSLRSVNGLFQLEDVQLHKCNRLDLITGLYITADKNNSMLQPVLEAQPKLTELVLCDIGSRTIPQSWIPDLCQLLRLWPCTLKKLSVCAFTLLDLKPSIFQLQTLDFLELFLPEDTSHVQFISMMARLSLQTLCPAVTSLRLMFDQAFCSHELPLSPIVDAQNCPPSLSVCEVTTEKAFCMPAVMETCISLFPNVLSFAFESLQCTEICETSKTGHLYEVYKIWMEIPTLERLKICVVDYDVSPRNYTLDALFCGISTTEARTIKQKHRKGLLDLQIFQFCPKRPSLSHSQGLKEVTVVLSARYTYKTFCISEVAGYLIFGRNPHLRLVIESHCTEACDDLAIMAQFGKITKKNVLDDWC